jgi:hypothetical protein
MTAMPGRGNGLQASAWAPLADLDPHLADAILEMLREEGIAAYVIPTASRSAGDIAVPPYRRPLDRLHVDREASAQARELLAQRLSLLAGDLRTAGGLEPESHAAGEPIDDAVWAEIMSTYQASPDEPAASSDEPAAQPVAEAGTLLTPAPGSPTPEPARDEERYVPPPPPPLPTADAVTRAAWAGVAGGPLFLLLATVLQLDIEGWLAFLAVIAFVAGFVTLVARSKDRTPDDAGPDDGAVV